MPMCKDVARLGKQMRKCSSAFRTGSGLQGKKGKKKDADNGIPQEFVPPPPPMPGDEFTMVSSQPMVQLPNTCWVGS
jgi:hypothetical protein